MHCQPTGRDREYIVQLLLEAHFDKHRVLEAYLELIHRSMDWPMEKQLPVLSSFSALLVLWMKTASQMLQSSFARSSGLVFHDQHQHNILGDDAAIYWEHIRSGATHKWLAKARSCLSSIQGRPTRVESAEMVKDLLQTISEEVDRSNQLLRTMLIQ